MQYLTKKMFEFLTSSLLVQAMGIMNSFINDIFDKVSVVLRPGPDRNVLT